MIPDDYCYYSDLPSPLAYMKEDEQFEKKLLTKLEEDRIIEMAWEDRTPFDAIKIQFGITEAEVKALMKRTLKFSSYKLWRKRVENCKTKHAALRVAKTTRFKSAMQKQISNNKISKRK